MKSIQKHSKWGKVREVVIIAQMNDMTAAQASARFNFPKRSIYTAARRMGIRLKAPQPSVYGLSNLV